MISRSIAFGAALIGIHCHAQGYAFVSEMKLFSEAKAYCQSTYPQGNLVSIHSAADNAVVQGLCENLGQLQAACWLGMDNPSGNVWHDGTSVDYSNWYPGEPDGGSAQPCVVYRVAWHTVGYCEQAPLPFVCEFLSSAPTMATAAPTTQSPTTALPTTAAPTSSPTTASPTTASPTTTSPTTAAPTTTSPTTAFPTTTTETANGELTGEGEVGEDEQGNDTDEQSANIASAAQTQHMDTTLIFILVSIPSAIVVCGLVVCVVYKLKRKQTQSREAMAMTDKHVNGEPDVEGVANESTINVAMPMVTRPISLDSVRHEDMYRDGVAEPEPPATKGKTTKGRTTKGTTRTERAGDNDSDDSSSSDDMLTKTQPQHTTATDDANTKAEA